MKLSLGPNLFYWERQQTLAFYEAMATQPLDRIQLGETVCSKRRAITLDDWMALGRELRAQGIPEVVLSGLALVEASSELSMLARICENGEFLVEANDMGAVHYLASAGLPFVAGPALNLYSGHALAELQSRGLRRWVPPVECPGAQIGSIRAEMAEMGVPMPEVEVFAYGHLPLAYSARCFTARAENRPKDDCQICCQSYPEGIAVASQEGEPVFVLNGIQTMSGQVTNLLGDYADLIAQGVDALRLSPRAEGIGEVIAAYDAARRGVPMNTLDPGCNGYWHGRPGMIHVQEQHA